MGLWEQVMKGEQDMKNITPDALPNVNESITSRDMLELLDALLFSLHVIVIAFNCTGWIFRRTRRLHLCVLGLTALSWFGLGIWKGWGYCFLTDWEWEIKRQLGETDLPGSFIHYCVQKLGISVSPATTDFVTGTVFFISVVLSLYFNFIVHRKNK